MASFRDEMTIQEAKAILMQAAAGRGRACPCCDQFAKVYRRPLSAPMAVGLIRIYGWLRGRVGESVSLPELFDADPVFARVYRGGDFVKLVHWGLIEEVEVKEGHTEKAQGGKRRATSGRWRLTPLGASFVQGDAIVHSHAVIYNNRLIELAGKEVMITDCLGKKFNYEELMGPAILDTVV